jgi:hypothetical protein
MSTSNRRMSSTAGRLNYLIVTIRQHKLSVPKECKLKSIVLTGFSGTHETVCIHIKILQRRRHESIMSTAVKRRVSFRCDLAYVCFGGNNEITENIDSERSQSTSTAKYEYFRSALFPLGAKSDQTLPKQTVILIFVLRLAVSRYVLQTTTVDQTRVIAMNLNW